MKELIIEWQDYQTEVTGCILLPGSKDNTDNWYDQAYDPPFNPTPTIPKLHPRQRHNFKQLLQFVKPPGQRTMIIQVATEQLLYLPIDLTKCERISGVRSTKYSLYQCQLQCKLISLFDENEVLPIKNAHMTVEIVIQ